MKYDMVVVEFILLGLSIGEIFINKKLCDKLNNLKWGIFMKNKKDNKVEIKD